MALTISNRIRMYTGGMRLSVFQAAYSVSTTDDSNQLLLHFPRCGYSFTPISTTTGTVNDVGGWAAQQWITYTNATGLNSSALLTLTNGITLSSGFLVGWGV